MSSQEFIAKWQTVTLSECSACKQHFLDLRELLNHRNPLLPTSTALDTRLRVAFPNPDVTRLP